MTKDQLFSILEETVVTQAVELAVPRFPFAEEVFMAAKWRIARDFESGELIEGSNPPKRVVFIPPNRLSKSPGLLTRYYHGRDRDGYPIVVVDWILFVDYDEAQAVTPQAYVANR